MQNILITGVGGQGSLLASRILGRLFLNRGFDVKVSEVHGMSQRGGSVVTYVRAGESVASPIIGEGEADLIIAFEELEGLRWIPYLKKGGTLAVSTQHIPPAPVLSGAMEYPGDIAGKVKSAGVKLLAADAQALADKTGNSRSSNIVMLGAASAALGFTENEWIDAISGSVKKEFVDSNIAAFKLGAGSLNN